MPEDATFGSRNDLLTHEELTRLVSVLAAHGLSKVRLTGGEPTVRRGLVPLVESLVAIPGIKQVVMTTNGSTLTQLAGPLHQAGLKGINVSLDTLDESQFARITRGGNVLDVIRGIENALAVGLKVKINAVIDASMSLQEAAALCRFSWQRNMVVRFIEQMPLSSGSLMGGQLLTGAQIKTHIETQFGETSPVPSANEAGPARTYQTADGNAFGLITPMSNHFCGTCNRMRINALGQLHSCLGHDRFLDLREILRNDASDDDLMTAIKRELQGKSEGHDFLTIRKRPKKAMVSMGG